MKAEDRLAKLLQKGGTSFSVETLNNATVLITIIRTQGKLQEAVGGSYSDVDEGINDCIDKLEEMVRKRSKLKIVKK